MNDSMKTKFSITVEGGWNEKISSLIEFLDSNEDQICLFYRLRIRKFMRKSNQIKELLSLPSVSENLFYLTLFLVQTNSID